MNNTDAVVEALAAVLARDAEWALSGAKNDCGCNGLSRDADREYENGTCPHQRARAAIAAYQQATSTPAEPTDEARDEDLLDELATTLAEIYLCQPKDMTWEDRSEQLARAVLPICTAARLIDEARANGDAAETKVAALTEELKAIKAYTWCWPEGDCEAPYSYPLEWAEYDLDIALSPHVAKFEWAGRLPSTWAVFTWAPDGDNGDNGEWNVAEYESEAAARAALASNAGGVR